MQMGFGRLLKRVAGDERGAITVEWVALAAAVVIGAITIGWLVLGGLKTPATNIGNQLSGVSSP